MKTIRVIAAKGRRVPIHHSVASAPGGAMLTIGDAESVELPLMSYVRRRINAGDLIEVKAQPAPKPVTPAPPKES